MTETSSLAFSQEELQEYISGVIARMENTSQVEELRDIRSELNGPQSPLTQASKSIGKLSAEQKKEAGQIVGKLRTQCAEIFAQRLEILNAQAELARIEQEKVDITLPVDRHPLGARHPISVLMERIQDFFISMGWQVSDGPEIEAEWFNFDSLNFGPDHPARQMQDTFYVKGTPSTDVSGFQSSNMVLRTQTSSEQVRELITQGVPIYVAATGRVFRTDELDATHTPVFHQCEALAVDKNLTMEDLKGTLDALATAMFGKGAKTRLRPSYFPFTEPSAEMDLWFPDKKGGPGWIEWGGCGMVNPRVLQSAGIDPEEYTGFAFGVGIERAVLLRNDIPDMHDLVEGDVRFSRQFGMGE